MNYSGVILNIFILFAGHFLLSSGRHLQFELTGYECFFQEIDENVHCTMEFAPISGANPQVDGFLEDPDGKVIYTGKQKDYDLHKFTTQKKGIYRICFSNVYDLSINTNVVYFDFVVGGSDSTFGGTHHQTALTQLDSSAVSIHELLNIVEQYQNYQRIREANSRLASENLHFRVQWWSVGQSAVVICVGIVQVFVLKRFFTVKKDAI